MWPLSLFSSDRLPLFFSNPQSSLNTLDQKMATTLSNARARRRPVRGDDKRPEGACRQQRLPLDCRLMVSYSRFTCSIPAWWTTLNFEGDGRSGMGEVEDPHDHAHAGMTQ